MTITELQQYLQNAYYGYEFKRLFHGRGGLYDGFKHLTIDSINTNTLLVSLFFEEDNEKELLEMILSTCKHKNIIVQRRYIRGSSSQVLRGDVEDNIFALENGMKFKLNLLSNQNIGFFADMKNGRAFVKDNAKDKRVLNLFSYTCSFSVAAMLGGANSVTNIDMSKSALSTGKANHSLNGFDRGVSYLPYNILKSFSNIKKKGPYDLIIIDPPTFQRGSFEASKDYEKIIKKLPQLASDDCLLLACLNSPDLDEEFLKEQILSFAPSFKFVKRLENLEEFKSLDESRSLKNLVFQRE
jgi:23S rRNA (cytosine1962-C5)-methyltransferase